MTTLVITEVDEALVERLRVLASATDRTIEQQARSVLEEAVPSMARAWRAEIAEAIAAMTPPGIVQTDSVMLLREDRSRDDVIDA